MSGRSHSANLMKLTVILCEQRRSFDFRTGSQGKWRPKGRGNVANEGESR